MKRAEAINLIIKAAKKPCPTIKEVRYILCTDERYYSIFGIPAHVRSVEPHVFKTAGYAYSRDGITYGSLAASEDALKRNWAEMEDKKAAAFRCELENESNARIADQFYYWCKDRISISE